MADQAAAAAVGPSPYLSVVVCSRNDDYAGNMVERLQTSLDVFIGQLGVLELEAEIVVVEWNPPPGRPALAESIRFDDLPPCVSVRVIRVPPEVHRRFDGWEQIPLNVPAANNVGLRRSRGRFVVLRASDVFYSAPLMALLAQRRLESAAVYRCNRVDVPASVLPARGSWRDVIEALAASPERREHHPLEPPSYPPLANLHLNASGDFLLAARERWMRIGGLVERPTAVSMDHDGLALHALVASGCEQVLLPRECCVFKLAHGSHTVDKVALQPLPERYLAVEARVMQTVRRVYASAGRREPENLGDRVRFWMRLACGLPRRELRHIGAVSHPTYGEFLYHASVLDRSRVLASRPAGGGLSAWLRLRIALAVLPQLVRGAHIIVGLEGLRALLARLRNLVTLRQQRPPYRMNVAGWGCEADTFEEARFHGAGGSGAGAIREDAT